MEKEIEKERGPHRRRWGGRDGVEEDRVDEILELIWKLREKGVSDLDRMLYLECRHFLADHNLAYTDKMSMAAGVEVRVPLLDPELVDLAFGLPAGAFEDDKAIDELVGQVAEDHRGTLLEVHLGDDSAIPLYAAPAAPLPGLPWGDPRHRAARDFAVELDQDVLNLLAGLNRHRQWDSLRNYNRLAALAPELRERRLQAVMRFPVLAAPVLLSAHHRLNLSGGKRYAWRDHDDAVLDAIDRGRDLAGALARHYDISKGLVRAPICAVMWGNTALSHRVCSGSWTVSRPIAALEIRRSLSRPCPCSSPSTYSRTTTPTSGTWEEPRSARGWKRSGRLCRPVSSPWVPRSRIARTSSGRPPTGWNRSTPARAD